MIDLVLPVAFLQSVLTSQQSIIVLVVVKGKTSDTFGVLIYDSSGLGSI